MDQEKPCSKCGAPLSADTPAESCPACLLAVGLETEDTARPEAAAETSPSLEEIAKTFPELEVLSLLGRGGMGVVYKARQVQLDRIVALKVLPQRVLAAPGFAERFTREARLLARLDHPAIVRIHDFGKREGICYLALEFVDGLNLRQLMASERLAPEQALSIVPQICEALEYAHAQGVVHRDIKPENILITKAGRVKIADFGLAKVVEQVNDRSITLSGHVMGTPLYMAPEQIDRPTEVDHRADIYSLGVVFYEMLTGELPLGRFRPPSEKVVVDVRLDEVVLRALERERERRYQSAADVRTEVRHITQTAPGISAPAASPTTANVPAGASPRRAPTSRLSRMAVVGCLTMPAVLLLFLALLPFGYSPFAANCAGLLLAIWFAGWVLSIVAWARIANSAGKLRGLGYAITGTLVPAVLFIPMIVAVLSNTVSRVERPQITEFTRTDTPDDRPDEGIVVQWNSFRSAVRESGPDAPEITQFFRAPRGLPEGVEISELAECEVRETWLTGGGNPSAGLTVTSVRADRTLRVSLQAEWNEGNWRFRGPWAVTRESHEAPVDKPAQRR